MMTRMGMEAEMHFIACGCAEGYLPDKWLAWPTKDEAMEWLERVLDLLPEEYVRLQLAGVVDMGSGYTASVIPCNCEYPEGHNVLQL
jgi:hypothetical protein